MKNTVNEFKTELTINGRIDDESANKFIEATQPIIDSYKAYKSETKMLNPLMVADFPTITVTINSGGGSIYAGNLIVDRVEEMQEMGIPMVAKGITCMSMAFIIFLSFEKRTANKLFAGMNHGTASCLGGYAEEMKADLSQIQYMDKVYDEKIRKQTNIPDEELEIAKLKCVYYHYDRAIELGIINYGYEGCETDYEALDIKYTKAVNLAIQTFAQVMEIEDEDDAFSLLYLGLDDMVAKTEEDEEIEGLVEELNEKVAQLKEESEDEEVEEHKCNCNGSCGDNCKCKQENKEVEDEKEEAVNNTKKEKEAKAKPRFKTNDKEVDED